MKTGIQWSAVFGASLMALGVGLMAGAAAVEKKVREEYAESAASYRRAMELARHNTLQVDGPYVELESEVLEATEGTDEEGITTIKEMQLRNLSLDKEPNAFGEGVTVKEPEKIRVVRDLEVENDYHKAIVAHETPIEAFVDGGVNDYGVSYIEQEDYEDESDGRYKGQITIVLDDTNPTFFQEGIQITNWDELVGDSILVDFFRLVPAGIDQVLYVRNHRRDEDYEVSRELP